MCTCISSLQANELSPGLTINQNLELKVQAWPLSCRKPAGGAEWLHDSCMLDSRINIQATKAGQLPISYPYCTELPAWLMLQNRL